MGGGLRLGENGVRVRVECHGGGDSESERGMALIVGQGVLMTPTYV